MHIYKYYDIWNILWWFYNNGISQKKLSLYKLKIEVIFYYLMIFNNRTTINCDRWLDAFGKRDAEFLGGITLVVSNWRTHKPHLVASRCVAVIHAENEPSICQWSNRWRVWSDGVRSARVKPWIPLISLSFLDWTVIGDNRSSLLPNQNNVHSLHLFQKEF